MSQKLKLFTSAQSATRQILPLSETRKGQSRGSGTGPIRITPWLLEAEAKARCCACGIERNGINIGAQETPFAKWEFHARSNKVVA